MYQQRHNERSNDRNSLLCSYISQYCKKQDFTNKIFKYFKKLENHQGKTLSLICDFHIIILSIYVNMQNFYTKVKKCTSQIGGTAILVIRSSSTIFFPESKKNPFFIYFHYHMPWRSRETLVFLYLIMQYVLCYQLRVDLITCNYFFLI